ncbi:D-alanyl-D-alanine carboxypeptidase/D-alanyl-D-alanine-endopeptidase [Jatrophihabitans fulvus]
MDDDRARRAARRALLVTVIVVLALAAGAAGFLVTREARTPDAGAPAAPAPRVYARATAAAPTASASGTAAAVPPADLRAALAGAVGNPALGRLLARVIDARTGQVLYDRSGARPTAPASTTKLATAFAALTEFDATDRFTTSVRTDGRGTVVLVGGGDPTLSAAPAGADTLYPQAGRLSTLARAVARSGVRVTRVVVDGSRFAGPSVSPAWASEDVPSSYGAAVTAFMADGGRPSPTATVRSATPDLAAGQSFAALLGRPSVPVVRGSAGTGRTIASVRSAPVGVMVEQMLLDSDNVIAEVLSRQVAVARKLPVSFTGGAAATRAVLRAAGLDPGTGLVDGSGLAARDRLTPAFLAQLLRTVATAPADDPVREILAGLPVAAWSGSLQTRYLAGSARAAQGAARAKTGTLTGVSTLAGFVPTAGGRLLAFALAADGNADTPAAQGALDTLVGRIAACRCS